MTATRSVEADTIFDGVKMVGEVENATRDRHGRLYLGSIDPITAANWAKECGHAIGTRGFADFAKKKLMSGEFSKFRAPKSKVLF